VEQALSRVASQIATPTEVEMIRARIVAMPALPERPMLHREDAWGALGIFLIVVCATFPVVLPFIFMTDAASAKWASRIVALVMLFIGGLALGRYAGYGSIRMGLAMMGLGVALVMAITALGG
jgi:VIT1/CCC1 family predicted Fe2+/Mn2+ transporter